MKKLGFILFVSAVLHMQSCKDPSRVALETTDLEKGKAAIEKITDQEKLADISVNAKNIEVGYFAVEKMTSQPLLKKVCDLSKEPGISIAALRKLADQEMLSEIVLRNENLEVCVVAVDCIKDPIVLANILCGMDTVFTQRIDASILADPNTVAPLYYYHMRENLFEAAFNKLIAISKDASNGSEKYYRVRAIRKMGECLQDIPEEHSQRILSQMMPAIRILTESYNLKKYGEITAINASWEKIFQHYHGDFEGDMPGEVFNCSIKLSKLTKPLTHEWATSFPVTTNSLMFCTADINSMEILETINN